MTVNNQVYLVFFEHTQIYLTQNGSRGAEENILKLSGNHAAPPAISYRRPDPLFKQVPVVLVNSNMGAVHYLHYFSIYASGGDPLLLP
ncbi:hypothetical protein ES703_49113 [subsurface metagenome]